MLHHAPDSLAENRSQLARYRDAVAAGVPGQPVRAAFIAAGGRLLTLAE